MAVFGLKGQTVLEVFQETPLASALQCGYGYAPLEIYTVGCVHACGCMRAWVSCSVTSDSLQPHGL